MPSDPQPIIPIPADPSAGAAPILNYRQDDAGLQFVQIGLFHDPVEANLACLMLRSSGIECAVSGETIQAALGGYAAPAAGGMRIQVAQSDAPGARSILAAVEARRAARLASAVRRCPSCNSDETSELPSYRPRLALLFLVITGALICFPGLRWIALLVAAVGVWFLILPGAARWQCTACGKRWTVSTEATEPEDDDALPHEDAVNHDIDRDS